jgi:hypothetical protein
MTLSLARKSITTPRTAPTRAGKPAPSRPSSGNPDRSEPTKASPHHFSLPDDSVQIHHPKVRQTASPNYSSGRVILQAGMD